MGAHLTPNLSLATYDPAEASSTYVRDWINFMSNWKASNMVILDGVIGEIRSKGTGLRVDIVGDGASREFFVEHARNTMTPAVSVYKQTQGGGAMAMSPLIEPENNASIRIEYAYPLAEGETHTVVVL
jgi:hypothetical protein